MAPRDILCKKTFTSFKFKFVKMVSSTGIKAAFITCTVIALILTLVSLFTPAWRSYETANSPSFGLVSYDCGENQNQLVQQDCNRWWNTREGYEKAVLAFMIIAAIAEIVTIIWALVIPKAAPRHYFLAPILALIAAIALGVAFIVYAAKNGNDVRYLPSATGTLNANHHVGYSFWLAVVAFIFMILATLLGFAATKRHNDELRPALSLNKKLPLQLIKQMLLNVITTSFTYANTHFVSLPLLF
uniref:Uncharacterized protein n=1 Tax=Panagrolaimus sp. ES5 TaxID=591445 RepID=A0AC34FYR9_9BILA